jgi:DNA-binding GntR family transcriptional regulator
MLPGMPVDDLDPYSGVAKYRQIADILAREIKNGTWPIGQPIPSRKTLEQRFTVVGETARRATSWLAQHGYVVESPGIGLIVTPSDRWRDQ